MPLVETLVPLRSLWSALQQRFHCKLGNSASGLTIRLTRTGYMISIQWHIPAEGDGRKTRHCHPNHPPHPFWPEMCCKSFMLPWNSQTHGLPTYLYSLSTVSYTKKHNLKVKSCGSFNSFKSTQNQRESCKCWGLRNRLYRRFIPVVGSLGLLPSPPQGSKEKEARILLSSTPAGANKTPVHYLFQIFGVSHNT